MSFGKVALGVASIVLGLNQLRNGTRHLQASKGTGLALGFSRPETRPRAPKKERDSGVRNTAVGPARLRTYRIRSLEERIAALRERVENGKRDPAVYAFARQAVNARCGADWCVPEKDTAKEIKALFAAIRNNVRYTSDIAGIDSYQRPGLTLNLRTGDCDDFSSLACAAAASLGIPCRFKVIRTKDSKEWNHIYAQMGLPRRNPKKWIPFDASVNMPVGWEAPASMVADSRVFPL